MDELLRQLLNQLDEIGVVHEELYDSECRQLIGNAIFHGFVKLAQDFAMPDDFGLFSGEGNQAVKAVLAEYILNAKATAAKEGLSSFHERLAAWQNGDVQSEVEKYYFDDYFGWSNPALFDADGNVIKKQ